MQPVKNDWCNFTYLGPRDDIGDLHVQRTHEGGYNIVRSFWKPTAQELDALNRGGTVVLGIVGMEPIPPVSLGVEFPPTTVELAAA